MSVYRRVSYADRCQIYAFIAVKKEIREISRELGFDRSTIYRELKRNSVGSYCASRAQEEATRRFERCRKRKLLRGDLESKVLEKLEERWSPEQISGRFKREKFACISHETIYRYVRARPELKAYWQKCLRRHRKPGIPRRSKRQRQPWMRSISERPKIVDQRKRFGDWERDTMYGLNRKMVLVCAERKSRLMKIAAIRHPASLNVTSQTEELLKAASHHKLETITNDNGGELLDGFAFKVPVYYCAPRKPGQRGTVENCIGLLRQYLPKGVDLTKISQEEIQKIEAALNNRPRKCLDWRTPGEVFFGTSIALAC